MKRINRINNRKWTVHVVLFSLSLFWISCSGGANQETQNEDELQTATAPNPQTILYELVGTLPHDTHAFTEGLEFYEGKLYESTGEFGKTSIRVMDPETGKIINRYDNPDSKIFGEGISHIGHKLYQLTYQSHQVFVYDEQHLDKPIATLYWPKEGWGLSRDSSQLLLSDGSATLYHIRPDDFKPVKTLAVQDPSGPVDKLNELEYINGFIYANRWQDDQVLKIDPETGYVVGKLHFEGVIEQYAKDFQADSENVLNGIAWDAAHEIMYVTGKNWPLIFKIKLNK